MAMLTRLLLFVICILLSGGMAAAQGVCSIQNIQGTYVNSVSIYAGNSPMASIGLTKIDATGHWTGSVTLTTALGTMLVPSEGEIEVNPDCTAVITQREAGSDHTWAAVILHNGKEIRSLQIDPPTESFGVDLPTIREQTLIQLSAGPRDVDNCSMRKLAGRYAQTCTGWIRPPVWPYLPTAAIGTITVSADGSVVGEGIMMYAGQKIPFTYKGLTVEANCSGLVSFELEDNTLNLLEGNTVNQRFIAFDEGKQMISITISFTGERTEICRFVRMNK